MLFEDRTNAIISPTNTQKTVLAITKASATPQVAASEISKGRNMMVARDMLVRLGLLIVQDNKAELTPQGEEIMRNQNLIDDVGALTPEGEKFAKAGTPQTESLIQSLKKNL